MNLQINIEIRDYDPGISPDPLTEDRIERIIQRLLDKDGSDGTVIVTLDQPTTTGGK